MRSIRSIAAITALSAVIAEPALSAADGPAPNPPVRQSLTEDGPIIVTDSGMTLYTYGPDNPDKGEFQCMDVAVESFPDPTSGLGKMYFPEGAGRRSCLDKWTPLIADENAVPGGDWSLVERPGFGKQWLYKGKTLYTFFGDLKPGDIHGAEGGGFGRGRGFSLAMAPLDFPPGLRLMRRKEGLVLATENARPVYTPGEAMLQRVSYGGEEAMQPIFAPAIASVSGDWSVVNTGAGRLQYAFRGQPLFAAPDSLSNAQIEEMGGWRTVIFRESAGTPAAIETRRSLIGEIYTDQNGRTLYIFNCSARGAGSCNDAGDPAAYMSAICGDAEECARRWKPYEAEADAQGVAEWSVIDVPYPMFQDAYDALYPEGAPSVKAWAYRGRPVFTFHMDLVAGDIWGNQIRWFGFSSFSALRVPGGDDSSY